jgi:SHS2 domain-containing protein
MVKKIEILPHTADVRLKVFGKTKEELFKNAMLGMAKILAKSPKSKLKIKNLKLKIKSPDINSLLVDFLSEILYQSQINHAVFKEVNFSNFKETELEAEISGFKIDEFDNDIKAVTYHELEIKKSPTGGFFETIIVFDI